LELGFMVYIAVVFQSGSGSTREMARNVVDGAQSVDGVVAKKFDVADEGFNWNDVGEFDAAIFGCPTYMGGLSGKFKQAIDTTGGLWAEQKWRGKFASGFTSSSNASGDKLNTLIQMVVFSCQHGMNWISLGLMPGDPTAGTDPDNLNRLGGWVGAMAHCPHSSEVNRLAASDAATARALGFRVAEVTKKSSSSK
jgi:multimeric flavodoxin WrbA